MGPNSKSLLRAITCNSNHPRIHVASFVRGATDGPSPDDIAIVGMSVNYPSGKGPEQLWETLEKGLNVVREIPSSRFQISDYYDSNADSSNKNPRKMNAKYGNFLDDPYAFDNTFFQISPREAKSMDPQQRLLLHAALEAMEDAGYAPDSTPSFQRESTGVYVGAATLDYVDNTRNDIDVYYSPGTLRAFLSGRISYAFQLKGPSVVIDTACSSSTVALYQACRALQAGDCTSALAGGVNVISSPDMYLGLSRAHFLSQTGQCKPWDASADGYCRAEGCGLFVLKKLSDAVAEGDRIYGVIRGVEVNQCGTAKSITHPDSDTQARLFKSLLTKTKIDPNSIGVVEAHGTGTQAGDYAEVSSLLAAFGAARPSSHPLLLSSIKGNIGHAEAASGAAGIAKLLLMMQKYRIPLQAAHQTLNPRLAAMTKHNMLVPTQTQDWKSTPGVPRRALLNNFGAAGSNAAVILEEYAQPARTTRTSPRSCHVLNISAKTSAALETLRSSYCEYIERNQSDALLASLCYSANARRQEYDAFRLSVTGHSTTDILRKLRQAKVPPRAPPSKGTFTTFVFSGQGGVYPGMGAELLSTAPVFRENVRLCNATLADLGFPAVDALIGEDLDAFQTLAPRDQVIVSQCACFVLEYCLAQLWMAWGVAPDVVTGHSVGEYAALVTAGVLSLRDGLLLVARRAELMADLCEEASTGMAACNMPPRKAASFISAPTSGFDGLTVACKNSTDDCVVGGPVAPLRRFVDFCKASGIKAKVLEVPFAFHSAAMDPILEPFAQVVSTVTIYKPNIPVASSYLGKLLDNGDVNAEYFVGHTRQPVEFVCAAEVIQRLADQREMHVIEVGPAPITLPMLKATFKQAEATFLPSLKTKELPWATISSTLSALYLQRTNILWRQVFAGLDVPFLPDLPRYPLSPSTFVVPFRETNPSMHVQAVESPNQLYRFLSGSRSTSPEGVVFKSKISALSEFIKAHNVGGAPLCPASVYIELAFEALDLTKREGSAQDKFRTLTDLTFDKPLVYSDAHDIDIHTHLSPNGSSFRVQSEGNTLHSAGTVATTTDDHVLQNFARHASYIKRQTESVTFIDTFSTRILYDVIFPRVVAYSGPYVTINQLSIAASGLEATGTFQLPASGGAGFACPPALTDTLLHAAGFVANSKVGADEACICVKVERVTVPCGDDAAAWCGRRMRVYCGLVECFGDTFVGDAYALDGAGGVLAAVEGMHFKRLRLRAFQAHLARALKPVAEPAAAAAARKDSAVELGRVVQGGRVEAARSTAGREGLGGEAVRSGIRPVLHGCLSELCGVAEAGIDENARLSEMGVDSLLFIELTSTLQQRFQHLNLTGSDFGSCETVLDVEQVLKKMTAGSSTPQFEVAPEVPVMPAAPECIAPSHGISDVDGFFQEVCGFSLRDVDADSTMDSLGVDSLLSIELASGLRETFGIEIDQSSISDMSIRELEKAIRTVPSAQQPEPEQEPVDIPHAVPEPKSSHTAMILGMDTFPMHLQKSPNTGKKSAPLYMFHDGSGLCNVYSRLGELGRDIYGIFSLDFSQIDRSITTLEELASHYIDRAHLAEQESIMLGGWSFGGVLAFEVSRQLRRRGSSTAVLGVVLVDSPHPVAHEPLPEAVVSHVCGQLPARTPAMRGVRAAIEAQFHRNARLLGRYGPRPAGDSGAGPDARCVMVKCSGTFDAEALCGVAYPWLSDDECRAQSVKVWESLVGRSVPTLDVRGNHFDLFSPENVGDVSEKLKRACQLLESGQ
ncbi:hypothetical protein GTA08_BOTSDO13036 [Neofusicoccum parvum]|nr:hypothetical protein GTA08_BOTSDO13036 [Neofusicoccum parvum]